MFITLTDFKDNPILLNVNHIKLIEPRLKGGSNIVIDEMTVVPVQESVSTIQKRIIKGKWGVSL